MISTQTKVSSRAQISRSAIQRLYIAMQHLFFRGSYKPLGVSGEAMINAMLALKPEIYGSIADPDRVELNGMLYVFQRLPEGIEECRYVKLISREGFENSFTPIIPSKRRRNCYRVDREEMYIEMTRGKSDIYDVLTHLTFMVIEAEKIKSNAIDTKGREKREWKLLKATIKKIKDGETFNQQVGYTFLSTLLGRTYDETVKAGKQFAQASKTSSLFNIVYWLGKYSIEEHNDKNDRQISFSTALRDMLGHHVFGERWAHNVKSLLKEKGLLNRPIHIISSNLHSVMNCFYAKAALKKKLKIGSLLDVAEELSIGTNKSMRRSVETYAKQNGMYEIEDQSGANIGVQIFDCSQMDCKFFPNELTCSLNAKKDRKKVIIVMDYAFGEQAYELMDELLKPLENGKKKKLDIRSINIMGKAGILEGGKGDIMIPDAHVFEGNTNNYTFKNQMDTDVFKGSGLGVYKNGPMITMLGTSLQNKDILRYFHRSSWGAIGLEMEGAHYQKAIQAASHIRHSIKEDVALRYAYYASDNPLETGSTLASGALGKSGVKPTYLITIGMINGVLNQ